MELSPFLIQCLQLLLSIIWEFVFMTMLVLVNMSLNKQYNAPLSVQNNLKDKYFSCTVTEKKDGKTLTYKDSHIQKSWSMYIDQKFSKMCYWDKLDLFKEYCKIILTDQTLYTKTTFYTFDLASDQLSYQPKCTSYMQKH